MFRYLEELSNTEAEDLKRTIKDLLKQTCILQLKVDPVTLAEKDNPRYRICEKHKEFIRDYLEVFDCELYYDPQEHIYRTIGDGVVPEKLNERTTLIILLLKLIYKDKIMGEGLNATITNKAEIREYGKDTNLINYKLTESDWRDAFTVMKTHQMIEIPCAISNIEDDTPIYIYNTVNIYCSSYDINELVEQYRDEVIKVTVMNGNEEEADAASEEDLY